jgi:integrase
MKTLLTEKLLADLAKAPRDVDVRDTRCRGLVLRCRASGRHSWRFQARRGSAITIGAIDDFTIPQARTEADALRGDVARGKDPGAEKRAASASSLKRFLTEEFEPWQRAHRKHADQTLASLRAAFPTFDDLPLKDITRPRVERWRTARASGEKGAAAATINRLVNDLRSVLTLAVRFGVLSTHPLAGLKPLKIDTGPVVRFLNADEEKRLRGTLAARDTDRREARANANAFRHDRGYPLLPAFGTYPDHVTPLVLLALNTGLRRGELLALTWADLDFDRAILTVRGEAAKSGSTRHVPLNREALEVLTAWRGPQEDRTRPVFAGVDGEPLAGTKTSWLGLMKKSKIKDFRFHDLRHTFASKLVMRGVDLNTARELLGHADLKMTLRYAHLAPEHKAAAVALLVK